MGRENTRVCIILYEKVLRLSLGKIYRTSPDNVRSYTRRIKNKTSIEVSGSVLNHPYYSPDLATNDYFFTANSCFFVQLYNAFMEKIKPDSRFRRNFFLKSKPADFLINGNDIIREKKSLQEKTNI